MATNKVTGFDSQLRMWQIWRDPSGMIQLTPVGHDTDPDGDGLSVADELALLALAPEEQGETDEDHIGRLYDLARDRIEDERMAA